MTTRTADRAAERVRSLDEDAARATTAFLDALAELEAPLSAVGSGRLPGMVSVPVAELREALARNEARVWRERERLYADGLTREEAARRLGVTPNQVTNLLRTGDLVGLDGADGLRLPAWQFDPEARRGRLEGIRRVAAVFPGRILGLSSWVAAPHPALAGRTPRQALLDGDVERAAAAAAHPAP